MRAPSVPAQLPAPGVLGPARTAPPPLRARGGVPSPSPTSPEPPPCARSSPPRLYPVPLACTRGVPSPSPTPPEPLPCARSSPSRLYPASLARTWGRSVAVTDSTRTLSHSRFGVSGRAAGGGSALPVPPLAKGEGSGEAPRAIRGKVGTGPGRGDCGGSLYLLYSPRRERGTARKCGAHQEGASGACES